MERRNNVWKRSLGLVVLHQYIFNHSIPFSRMLDYSMDFTQYLRSYFVKESRVLSCSVVFLTMIELF